MEVLGTRVTNFSVPVCSAFRPRDLNGQLCYSLNLTAEGLQKPGQGIGNGLTLAIDYNRDRSLSGFGDQSSPRGRGLAALVIQASEDPEMLLYVDTLQPFTGRGPGSYILSSLKQVTTSDNFDVMDASVRKCQFEQSWARCKREA